MAKYMFLFIDDETWMQRVTKEEMEQGYAEIGRWWEDLERRGVIKGGRELQPSRTAMTVRRVNGTMTVTDGPFIETKEQVGGYAVVEVADLDEAIRIAKSWPAGGVEVRPIVEH